MFSIYFKKQLLLVDLPTLLHKLYSSRFLLTFFLKIGMHRFNILEWTNSKSQTPNDWGYFWKYVCVLAVCVLLQCVSCQSPRTTGLCQCLYCHGRFEGQLWGQEEDILPSVFTDLMVQDRLYHLAYWFIRPLELDFVRANAIFASNVHAKVR